MEKTIASRQPARVRALGVFAVLVLLLTLLGPGPAALAQDDAADEAAPLALAEVPSHGAARPGPIRVNPRQDDEDEEAAEEEPEGVPPVAIQIDKAAVDATVERVDIVDGVMQNPSGPWVVSWYEDLAALGEESNVVMAGHIDYWDTGPAVFYNLPKLVEGDIIRVIAEDGEVYEYEVQWSRLYNVETELTPEVIQEEVVGDTGEESLTLITCGGEFNYETGEYVSRMVLRATRI